MKFWGSMVILSALVGLASFHITLYYIPLVEMSKVEAQIAKAAGGKNLVRYGTRPDSSFRAVVRPSPDQLYSACSYDLSDGPVRFSGVIPDTYWSLSIFAHNSDNFFVVNDSEIATETYEFVMIPQGQARPPGYADTQIIESPSETGIALVRMFIDREDNLEELDRVRKLGKCDSDLPG